MAFKTGWAKIDFDTKAFETQISNVETMPIDATSRDVTLSIATPPSGTGKNIHLLHIEFFQEVNGTLYPLKNGAYNSLSILDVV